MGKNGGWVAKGRVRLADYDPDDTGGLSKEEAETQMATLSKRLAELQELLFGAAKQSVLIVLQGVDTAGKDGTIRHVMSPINPAGCNVTAFKAPTDEDLRHDFLWRVHMRAPERGMMAIFNRSHYEDVLVARVHNLVPAEEWRQRYREINDFERMLTRNGTILIKFFLHISKAEQRKRLLAREDDPDKAWKLAVADWKERAYWDAYMAAYEDALSKCSTEWVPWHIVAANHKWHRNYVVARTIVEQLAGREGEWKAGLVERGKQELAALRAAHVYDEDGVGGAH